jgi:GT2 family glycosyltransferase
VPEKIPLVSCIVLNWNGKEKLRACLKSMQKFPEKVDKEIIVVDNGSKDGSVEMIKSLFPFVRLIENPVNYGIPRATNQGFAIAKGEYFFLCGNDTQMSEGWLLEPIKLMEKNSEIGVVGLLDVGPSEFSRRIPEPVDYERDNVASVAMLARRRIYDLIGGYDEKNFSPYGGDETDWNYRARAIGFKVYRTHRAIILHHHGHDTKRQNPNQFLLLNEHRLKAMLFNLNFFQLVQRIPGLAWIAWGAFLSGNFFVLLRSYWNNVKNWRTILVERKKRKGDAARIQKFLSMNS